MKTNRAKIFGYTLIELLVSLAIIGILAAMLVPALAAARSLAHSASCKNRLRQMSVALQLYVHDSRNQYPFYLGPAGPSYGDAVGKGGRAAGLVYWSSKLIPYHSLNWTNPAFHCPGYKAKISGPEIRGSIERHGSYAYNAQGSRSAGFSQETGTFGLGPVMFWKDAKGDPVRAVSESAVSVPSEMLAVTDAETIENTANNSGLVDGLDCGPYHLPPMTGFSKPPHIVPHGKNYNTLFSDGHVSAMPPLALFDPSVTAALWNYDHQPHPEQWKP